MFAVKEKAASIVEQFPRQREQQAGGFVGVGLRFRRRAFGQVAVYHHREAAFGLVSRV